MLDVLRRLILHIAGRHPPRLGDVAGFEDDADRQAARYADPASHTAAPAAADDWLRQGDTG
jgi:hypothetical protein